MSGPSRAIILGSGRGERRLDPTRSTPTALRELPTVGTLLEWVAAALREADAGPITFAGGYHIQKVVERHPGLRYVFHPRWEHEGEAAALAVALRAEPPADAAELLVVGDATVFRAEAVRALRESPGPAAAGMTTDPRDADGTSGGPDRRAAMLLLRAPSLAMLAPACEAAAEASSSADLASIVAELERRGVRTELVDLGGHAASVRSPRALASFVFGTKGETLERLAPMIEGVVVPPVYRFTVARWRGEPRAVLAEIGERFGDRPLVVRSSSMLEDGWESSRAGRYYSALNVPRARLADEIEHVIASYARGADDDAGVKTRCTTRSVVPPGNCERAEDQVLVQPYVADAVRNGVLFTRCPGDGAPYVVLNYDETRGRTDTVTAGHARRARTLIRHRGASAAEDSDAERRSTQATDPWTDRVLAVGRRLEEVLHHDGLDIEFAIDGAERVHLLQVRPIAEKRAGRSFHDDDAAAELAGARAFLTEHLGPTPMLLGRRSILGVMPDWNPAEIIGACPRPLALSLYRHVVTDDAWAAARGRMGYRHVRGTPLMLALAGRPYIDVRASLNSLLPADLSDGLAARAVDDALDRLEREPALHDKIEFELLPTCLDLDPGWWRRRLLEAGWSGGEVEAYTGSLRGLTDRVVRGLPAAMARCGRALGELARRRGAAMTGVCAAPGSKMLRAHALLADAGVLGAEPFAELARCAFIAVAMLRSMERLGILSAGDRELIQAGIPTVARSVSDDLERCRAGAMSCGEFLGRHGHLRPGTYDITSPSYADAPELYLGELGRRADEAAPDARPIGSIDADVATAPGGCSSTEADPARDAAAAVLERMRPEMARALRVAGFTAAADELIAFIVRAIPARESAKHEFTKNIAAALDLIADAGCAFDLARDDLSFLPIARLLQLGAETPSAAERTELHRIVGLNRKRQAISAALRLPHLIVAPGDIESFEIARLEPNFVTRGRAAGPGRVLAAEPGGPGSIHGAIVLIENADPGYDWIFSRGIGGLVTKYGGVASHMAIRAAEFGIPAAIGCGEAIFEPLTVARRIELDCEAKQVRRVA